MRNEYHSEIPGEHLKPTAMPRVDDGIRVGLFQANQRNAHYITSASGSSDATYGDVLEVARLADQMGLSFLLPVSRWKGIAGDDADFCPYGLETLTLTAALLQATEMVTIFTTVHTDLFNPAVLAKMGATLDQIGNGRWGLNVVAGWNEADFVSMGLSLRDHADRYEHATHWLAAVRELWRDGHSSYSCKYFELHDAECLPRPVQTPSPIVVNAGASPTGMQFAVDNADYLFSADANIGQYRVATEELGGEVGYIGRKHVVIKPTTQQAVDQANDIVAGADRKAMSYLMAHGKASIEEARAALDDDETVKNFILQKPIIGNPDEVAVGLADWVTSTEVDGICLSLFDQLPSLELFRDEVFDKLGNELEARGKNLVLTGD